METALGKFFKVKGLDGAEWGVCIALGFGCVLTSYLLRLIPIKETVNKIDV